MIVTIDTRKQTVTISEINHFGELVDWEDYYDYEVVFLAENQKPMTDYLASMQNLSHT